jgi:hypothetical protein
MTSLNWRSSAAISALRPPLGVAHRQSLGDDFGGEPLDVRRTDQRASMPHVDPTVY